MFLNSLSTSFSGTAKKSGDMIVVWLPSVFHEHLLNRSIPCGRVRHVLKTIVFVEISWTDLSEIYKEAIRYLYSFPELYRPLSYDETRLLRAAGQARWVLGSYLLTHRRCDV